MLWFIFSKILVMSVAASLGGILVFVVSKLFSKQLSKKAICAFWLLPLSAAIIPFCAPKGLSGIMQKPYKASYVTEAYYEQIVSDPFERNLNKDVSPKTASTDESNNKNGLKPSLELNGIFRKATIDTQFYFSKEQAKNALSLIYFAIALFLFLRLFVKSAGFNKKIKKAATKCEVPFLEECKNRVGYSKNTKIYSLNLNCSPFVFGVLRPIIVLPFGKAEKTAFIHELVHIKKRDTLKLMILNIIKCIHFFNPLLRLFAKEIKRCTELCRDEEVAAILNGEEKIAYGKSILNCCYSPIFSAVCLSENGENIKERISTVMKTKSTSKKTRAFSLLLAVILFAGQGAFSVAAANAAPQKSYAVNHTNKVYSLVWQNGEETLWSKTSGIGANSATLVNTPFHKTFSADLKVELCKFRNSETEAPVYADIHIETDKILKTINNGKHWSGLFNVTVNGKAVLSKAKGCINYVPGNYDRKTSRLFISGGDTSFDLEYIDFDTEPDSVINAEYENYKKINFEPELSRMLLCNGDAVYQSNSKTKKEINDFGLKIKANKTQGKLYITEIPIGGTNYIEAIPEEKYRFGTNSVNGKFYLMQRGGIIFDEFEATLTGFESGNLVTLKSSDKKMSVSLNCAEEGTEYDREHFDGEWTGLNYGLDDGSDFPSTCKNRIEPTTLERLPFTLELNKEKTKIIFKIKDGFSPDGWYYSYSSYSNTDKDVFSRCKSEDGKTQTELDICDVPFANHNLHFYYYTSDPYAHFCFVDIMFKITDESIYYRCCNNYITENKNYSGQKAKDALDKYILIQK